MSERLAVIEYYYARDLINVVRLLKSVLYHNAVFRITKNGIEAKGLDSSGIQYVEIFIPNEYFNRYDLYSDSVDVSLDLDELEKVLKSLKRGEHVTISVYSIGDDIAVYISTKKSNYAFYNAKPHYTSDIPNIDTKHKVKAVINTELLHRIIKFIDESSSTYYDQIFEISTSKDQQFITIRSKNAEFKLDAFDLVIHGDTIVSRYDSRQLAEFTEHLRKLSRYVTLMYDRDQPLELLAHEHNIKIRYLQAPVV